MFFRGKAFAVFWNLEPTKSRSRELAIIWNLELAKSRSRELAIIWNLEPAEPRSRDTQWSGISNLRSHEFRETGDSGIRWKSGSEVMNKGIHEQVRSKVKVVVSKSPGLGCELVAGL
jgi:hypothetical protein